MKKVFPLIFLFILPLFLVGCGTKKFQLQEYMSEITTSYYQAEGEGLNISLSVGQREIDYKVDGLHGATCGFSLFEIKFDNILEENTINISVIIDGKDYSLVLEHNPVNNTYMGDLGFAISNDSSVQVKVEGQTLNLTNVSNNFAVSSDEALEKASVVLIDELASCYNNGNFCGECYLKILNEQDGSFNELFWCFSLVCNQGIKYDVVINVQTGEVVGVNL